jgi:hypothetical protein
VRLAGAGITGRRFAAAKTLGVLDLAADLANRSLVEIGTLLRATRNFQESNPRFPLHVGVAALKRMAAGRFYELRARNIWDARRYALEAAEATGQQESIRSFLGELITSTDTFLRGSLWIPGWWGFCPLQPLSTRGRWHATSCFSVG